MAVDHGEAWPVREHQCPEGKWDIATEVEDDGERGVLACDEVGLWTQEAEGELTCLRTT